MTTTDAEIVQPARHLHDQIRHAIGGQAQDLFDHPTPFDPSQDVCHDHARPRDAGIEEVISHAQGLASRLFWGGAVHTPAGSSPCKPVSLARVALAGETIAVALSRLLVVRFAWDRWPQRDDLAGVFVAHDDGLVGMGRLCAAGVVLVPGRIRRALAAAFGPING